MQLRTLVPQTGEVYKTARHGPTWGLNNSLRLINSLPDILSTFKRSIKMVDFFTSF